MLGYFPQYHGNEESPELLELAPLRRNKKRSRCQNEYLEAAPMRSQALSSRTYQLIAAKSGLKPSIVRRYRGISHIAIKTILAVLPCYEKPLIYFRHWGKGLKWPLANIATGKAMKRIWNANCTVSEAVDRLTAALMERKFGVLHIHDLKKTLNSKGVPFDTECQVLEVCNPSQAAAVLAEEIELNMALPCRVSVYEKNEKTQIGMMSPKIMLEGLSDSPKLRKVAEEVEAVLEAAIEEAAK